MIEQLFGSKTRVKLLSLFLNNPDRPFYVREITRKIDEQINSVRRELSNLLSVGIIKSASSQNKLYYEVDQKYEYFEPLRQIFAKVPIKNKALKETREEDKIAKKLRTTGRIEQAFLTGAFTRQPHAGVDIFMVGDVNRAKAAKVIEELEQELGHELNYSIMTPEDYQYRLGLNDRFLTTILESKRIKLIDQKEAGEISHTDLEIDEGATPVAVKLED